MLNMDHIIRILRIVNKLEISFTTKNLSQPSNLLNSNQLLDISNNNSSSKTLLRLSLQILILIISLKPITSKRIKDF